MQQREKFLLAGLLGAVGLWVLLPALEGVLLGPFQSRIARRDELQEQVASKTQESERLGEMQRQLLQWSVESLPPDPLNAQRVYSEWLVDLARMSGLKNIVPQLPSRSGAAQVYTNIPVILTAETTLQDLATFLHRFNRTGLLHRITKCDVKSTDTEGNPTLEVTISAEGIALRDAPQHSRLFPRTTLKAEIAADAGEIKIAPGATFPPDTVLRVKIDHEYLNVTKRAGDVWTVARGVDGTTAAEHAADAIVEYAPLKRNLDPKGPQSVEDYERLLSGGPFAKPRPPFVYRPQLTPITNQTLMRGTALDLQAKLSGWDPANGPAVYELDEFSPASMQIDNEGRITWSPAATTDTGEYPVGVIVSSKSNPDVSLSTNFLVTLRDANLPPSLQPPASVPVAWIGREWSFTAVATDPEGANGLTYSIAGQPPEGLSIDPATGKLSWQVPETVEPGAVPVTVQVTDQGEPPLSATAVLNVSVADDPKPFTYLSGLFGQGETFTAYVYDRSSNKSWTLKVGDPFQVADVSGKVSRIEKRSMEIDTPEGTLQFVMDVPLSQAKLLPAATLPTDGAAAPANDPNAAPPPADLPPSASSSESPAPAPTEAATTAPANEPAADR